MSRKQRFIRLQALQWGETVQINWYISNGYGPYRSVFRVEKDGNVLDEWIYESDTDRDTFTVTAAGEYVIYVTVTDAMNLSATAQRTLTVTDPGPLNLKKIELSPDSVLGKTYEGQLYWYLESEGGYGDKKTDVYLLRADTGEEECVISDEYWPAGMIQDVTDGIYLIRMNVKDDQGGSLD